MLEIAFAVVCKGEIIIENAYKEKHKKGVEPTGSHTMG